jgi:uncharacterized protein YlxW (UPF0749 family)
MTAPLRGTAELVDLVLNPHERGYEVAAARRGPNPARRWYDRPAVALGCLAIGFVLVVAYVQTHRAAPEAAKVHDSLVQRVHAAERQDATLAATAQQLNDQLNRVRGSALGSGPGAELRRSQLIAGQVAAHGPGLQVVLSEPPAPSPTGAQERGGTVPITATHVLSDRDVRSIVNQLWADGAEAISVNNVRLTPTSAIRFAGQAVLVDFQPIASPYTVRAIGDPDALATGFASSAVAGRYKTLSSAEGIGFSFGEAKRLVLPASPGEQPKYASPAPTKGTR